MYFCGVSGMYQCQVCYAMLQNRLFLHCSLLFSFSVFVAAQIWGKSRTAAISKTGWKRVLKETLKWWRNPICWPRRHILRARMAGYVLQVSFHPPQQCVRYDWLLKCLPGNCCSHLGPNTVILKLPERCDAWLPGVSSKSSMWCLAYHLLRPDKAFAVQEMIFFFFLLVWETVLHWSYMPDLTISSWFIEQTVTHRNQQ